MSSSGTKEVKDLKVELVIIGGGGAGLAAAVAAIENGISNVIVLEKRNITGGNSAMAKGPFAAESPAQRRQAIIAPRDELFKRYMSWAHLQINPRIVRAFIDKSGDTIRWLEEKGLHFDCHHHSPVDMPLTWHVPKGNGKELMKVLARECQKLGVEVLTRTSAKKILIGEMGRITGVLAERKGDEFIIKTKSIIVATGGYGGNQELLKKHCPESYDKVKCAGIPHTGDGLIMVNEVGAANDGLGTILMAGPSVDRSTLLRLGTEPDILPVEFTSIQRQPYMVWVNKKGRRFIDETTVFNRYESVNAAVRQPDGLSYTLFDNNIVRMMTEQGLVSTVGVGKHIQGQRSKFPAGLEKELHAQVNKGGMEISESWDGIADWMGADREVLKAEIDEYNIACDKGYDPVFAKDRIYLEALRTPPYYAIRCKSLMLNTMGGIKINELMEVLDKQDKPIPGLYAAGVDAGGWTSDTYCGVLPGTAFGFALNSGRIAAENVVRFISRINSMNT
ncbi:FAD-dependent oxidoreductase [Thermodesulfobacteriota bacterium]